MLGAGGSAVLAILVIVSTLGALTGIVLAGPRVYYSMALDGLAVPWLGHVHPTYRTPSNAIVAQGIWSSVLAATGAYQTLFTRVIYTEWLFFALMAAGLFVLRRRPGYDPPYRTWGYPVVPAVFILTLARHRGEPDLPPARRGGRRSGPRGDRSAGLLSAACASLTSTIISIRPTTLTRCASPASLSRVKVTIDDEGNPCVHYPGDYNILVPGHRDIDYRAQVLDEHGVETQLLTFTTPGVHVETPELAGIWRGGQRRLRGDRPRAAAGASRRWPRCP